ncbi:unnamed product [Ostreococcus tauri]|jgi:CDAN1-interacting nuclease 1|nr:unnamed product [Ostreococcus tauri]CEF99935.1 unnamed product [Ostreococcus tauri]|eukprot:XP_022840119.1 unnamed product [Ostreococcus tauri]
MRLERYEGVREALASTPCDVYPDVDAIAEAHPEVTLDALVSVYAQEASRKIRGNHGRHARNVAAHARRYAEGEDIFRVAADADFPACQMMRLLLEHLLGVSHKAVGGILREPYSRIPATPEIGTVAAKYGATLMRRLRADVERVAAWDHQASPVVDTLRHGAGKEYEDLLEELLRAEGIPFVTERDLRADGHARTPDIKLEVPIAVRGRIVNWIDSKASFSDPIVHVEKGLEQFQGYVNRFGPGMVIYWHGVVDELNNDPNVLLVDAFPPSSEITKLRMI